jgi:hypothetical protein
MTIARAPVALPVHDGRAEDTMRRLMLLAVPLAIIASGCVARVVGPPPPVVYVPAPQPVVVAPPPVVVAQPPVLVTPPVLFAPPRIVIVPGTQVYTVPSANFNVFVHSGRYYSYHYGSWFYAPRHGAPWTVVAVENVPAPVRALPVKHYKVPPGHEKKHDKRAERDEREDRHDRDDRDGSRSGHDRRER